MGDYCNYSSYFIEGKALFGGFPTQTQVNDLIKMGVTHFVDLTFPNEVTPMYTAVDVFYANFPILDRKVPYDIVKFVQFVLSIFKILSEFKDNKMYIHCKGGHGRAGILVALLLYLHMGNITSEEAIKLTTKFHNNRKIMRQKWRDIGSPQTRTQIIYVHKLVEKLFFFRAYRKGPTTGFSNYSFHDVTIPENKFDVPTGVFPSSESAYQASKKSNDGIYVRKQLLAKSPRISRKLGEKIQPSESWIQNRYIIMRFIIELKIKQHPEILEKLMNTGLKTLIFNSHADSFFGIATGKGSNHIGKILMNIRNREYARQPYVFRPLEIVNPMNNIVVSV